MMPAPTSAIAAENRLTLLIAVRNPFSTGLDTGPTVNGFSLIRRQWRM
jgi:hypothetical protein